MTTSSFRLTPRFYCLSFVSHERSRKTPGVLGGSQVLKKRGRGGEAIALYTQAQEIYERLHGPEAQEVAGCLNNIASVFTDQVLHRLLP